METDEEKEGFMSKEGISANSLTLSEGKCLRGEKRQNAKYCGYGFQNWRVPNSQCINAQG